VIRVTRLDGTPMLVNVDQITWVEFTPDTVISLANGEKLLVRDAPDEIVHRVHEFKRALTSSAARERRADGQPFRIVD
jgi:flagellar protein FlbD